MEEVRYCEKCGKQFVVKYASITKRFCSHKCSSAWKWENVRERQPLWRINNIRKGAKLQQSKKSNL